MERIVVSNAWRVSQCNSTFNMKFASEVDMNKAFKAMENAIMGIDKEYYKDYLKEIWLQDLGDCCKGDKFDIMSALSCEAFSDYIPEMCKAVANAFPEIEFEGYAYYDDLQCYYVVDYNFSYKNGVLSFTRDFRDDECGYFCPECGCFVAYYGNDFDEETVVCDDCDETIKIADLVVRKPALSKFEYKIK